jgi:glycosyltransferase involved in cell wall biosynthesis
MLSVHHINLQRITGGGEVYTHSLTRAFADAGAAVSLYVHPQNRLWDDLACDRIELVRVANEDELVARLPARGAVLVTQSPISMPCKMQLLQVHALVEFSHLPITSGRGAEGAKHCHLVVTVSRYCIELLQRAGITHVYPEPMYGTTEAQRGDGLPIVARSPYRWDDNKFRDVVLGALEPLVEHLRKRDAFARRPGLSLGVVSLISPIKQFPLLFTHLAPILARREPVNVEVFGDGGYAQVRDVRQALAPLGGRVRFWGYQKNVHDIYPQLDYLLAGLPDKEALGLNVLEAQMCGTPVLAPRAAPFTETVQDGCSGFFYRDPREDRGAEFATLIDAILAGRPRPDPRVAAAGHLRQFSYEALVERVRPLLARMSELSPG